MAHIAASVKPFASMRQKRRSVRWRAGMAPPQAPATPRLPRVRPVDYLEPVAGQGPISWAASVSLPNAGRLL
jgi:hypothetical protein